MGALEVITLILSLAMPANQTKPELPSFDKKLADSDSLRYGLTGGEKVSRHEAAFYWDIDHDRRVDIVTMHTQLRTRAGGTNPEDYSQPTMYWVDVNHNYRIEEGELFYDPSADGFNGNEYFIDGNSNHRAIKSLGVLGSQDSQGQTE